MSHPACSLADRLDGALPQTQCTRCGYADCRGYAEALAGGAAHINQCPPGGAQGVGRLAALTGEAATPLNPAHGVEGPRQLAVIDESGCIGCTLCLQACPVDCIVGGPKAMHTVIARLCTGCELCLPACPVDCISLLPVSGERTGWDAWSAAQADESRQRYGARRARLRRDIATGGDKPSAAPTVAEAEAGDAGQAPASPALRPSLLAAVLERARAQRAS